MKVLISGSHGLVGSELVNCLSERGHDVFRLVRKESDLDGNTILWDPEHHELKLEEFENFDCVINLAGENIASGRWTAEKKKKIKNSRVMGTHMLAELLARLENPPRVLINASAVGYYGDRGDEVLTERSSPGDGFLANVCKEWEEATNPAKEKGIRVVLLRFGLVLSENGGVLKKMLLPFKMGLGGVLGSGKQYMSWISIDDLMGIVLHVMSTKSIQGPVNVVSPNPATNRTFTKTLGKVLSRPTILPVPAFLLRLVFKEMAEEMFLASTRAVPDVLQNTGYHFLFPELKPALEHLINKS